METIKLKQAVVSEVFAREGYWGGKDMNGYIYIDLRNNPMPGGVFYGGDVENPVSAWEGSKLEDVGIQKIWGNHHPDKEPKSELPYMLEIEYDAFDVTADHPIYEQLPDNADTWTVLLHVDDDEVITGVTLWA